MLAQRCDDLVTVGIGGLHLPALHRVHELIAALRLP
jgi:hypothetical protein